MSLGVDRPLIQDRSMLKLKCTFRVGKILNTMKIWTKFVILAKQNAILDNTFANQYSIINSQQKEVMYIEHKKPYRNKIMIHLEIITIHMALWSDTSVCNLNSIQLLLIN